MESGTENRAKARVNDADPKASPRGDGPDPRPQDDAAPPHRQEAAAQPPRGGAGEGSHDQHSDDDAPLLTFDIAHIMRAIPHRYPFLLVDRIVEVRLEQSAVGIKNVTMNEPFFQGHFPQEPVMPGVLIIECMAQTAAVLVVESLGPHAQGKLVYFMTIENAKFRKPVKPGDQLRVRVVRERKRGNVWKFNGEARVDGVLVAEAHFGAMILDR